MLLAFLVKMGIISTMLTVRLFVLLALSLILSACSVENVHHSARNVNPSANAQNAYNHSTCPYQLAPANAPNQNTPTPNLSPAIPVLRPAAHVSAHLKPNA